MKYLAFLTLLQLWSGVAAAQVVPNASFEAPEVGSGSVATPTVSGQTFTNDSGVAGNGSSLGFQAAPDGDQVGYLMIGETAATISFAVSGLTPGKSYRVNYWLAKRPYYIANSITVTFGSTNLGAFSPTTDSFAQKTTATFVAGATTGTLTFTGTAHYSAGGSAIDKVEIVPIEVGVDPSFKVGEGVPITPSAAAAQFGGATTHTNGPGYSGRSSEVKSIARGLGSETAAADPGAYLDRVYEYVRNNIAFEPMFGSAKGPLGTIIDRSGTAFDQSQLMIELLAEGGISADYQFGDIVRTSSFIANWLRISRYDGFSEQSVVEQMLADGGIPFTSSGSDITMAHVWVRATIPTGSFLFDPALKGHFVTSMVNLPVAMGYDRAALVSAVENGAQTGSLNGISTLKALNASGLDSYLNVRSATLISWINANRPISNVEDVLDGRIIARNTLVGSALRRTTLSYVSAVRATWPGTNGIPDQYRTKMKLRFEAFDVSYATGGDPLSHLIYFDGMQTYFTDEIYGQRFWIDTAGSLKPFSLSLKVGDNILATATATQPGASRGLHPMLRKNGHLTLTIDHPYPAAAGTYLDRSALFRADYVQPLTIVLGLGQVSERLASRHGPEMYGQRKLTPISEYVPGEGLDPIIANGPNFKSDHIRTRIADAWMAQASRMGDLQARVGGGYYIQHHLMGVSYGQTELKQTKAVSTDPHYNPSKENVWIVQDLSRLSVDSAVSIRSKTAGASPTGMRQATAAASAALEGSIFEQQQNVVDGVSTASRLAWANNIGSGINCQVVLTLTCSGKVPLDFALIGAGQAGQTDFVTGNYTTGTFTTLAAARNMNGIFGYTLGPGLKYAVVGGTQKLNVFGHGAAYVAFNSSFTEFFHEVRDATPHTQKGGGGSISQDTAHEFDPHKIADILKDTFKDRSSLHGVSLANGQLSYTPAPDLVIGSDGPAALSFQRFFSGSEGHSFGLPDGWTHNWDYSAELSSSGMETMGASSVRAAATSIVAFLAMQDIYGANPGALNNQIEGLLIADWWRRQMVHNVLTVRRARSTEQFISVPTGVSSRMWVAPNGNAASVAVSGAPALFKTSSESLVRSWKYDGMSVTWTGPRQEQIAFTLRLRPKNKAEAPLNGEFDGEFYSDGYFLPTTMTDTAGRATTFSWIEGNRLTGVSNAFGRSLSFTYDSSVSYPTGAFRPLVSVSDNANRSVSFTYANLIPWELGPYADQGKVLAQVNLPGGRNEGYTWVGNGTTWSGAPSGLRAMHTPRLREVHSPQDMISYGGTLATLRFAYDVEWRTATMLDAQGTHDPGSRQPWKFLVADLDRSMRIDPLGGVYQVVYDHRGRAAGYIEELGRTSTASFDSWDRVASRTAPEGDKTTFAYDSRSNVTGMTRIAKSGSGLANLTASATYDPLFNAPTSVTDFNLKVSNISYVQSGNGKGEILQALRPADQHGLRPQFDFTYTQKGLVDTATTKIDGTTSSTSKNYYDSFGNLTMSVVDNGGLKLATCYEYDAVGNRTAVTDGRAATCVAP